jgi:hypothetical protein
MDNKTSWNNILVHTTPRIKKLFVKLLNILLTKQDYKCLQKTETLGYKRNYLKLKKQNLAKKLTKN